MIMLKAIFVAIFIMGTLSFRLPDKTKSAKIDNGQKSALLRAKDSQFLVHAAEINMEEVLLGQLAQKKSKMQDVKELGQMMEEAHTQSMSSLAALAKKKKINVPTMPTHGAKDAYKKLDAKSESDFNKAYCEMMVSGHKDAIAMFEKAVSECTDEDIKEWAITTLPVLRTHLDHSVACQKKCETLSYHN